MAPGQAGGRDGKTQLTSPEADPPSTAHSGAQAALVAGKRKPFKLTPPDPTEDQFQASIANLLDAILDEERVVWTHVPAGGYLLTPAARARLYRLGLKRGFSDIVICYSLGRTLWMEVKTPTGTLSPAQRLNHLRLGVLGHNVAVVRRIEEVIAALIEYNVPFRKARLAEGYHGVPTTEAVPSAAQGKPKELSEGTPHAA